MPFTFCHPAIILPLTKSKKLSTSALIIGSTAPDFEFFIRFELIKTFSHSFWSMFYFSFPLVFFLYLVFHTIVKNPLITHLPHFLFKRFHSYQSNFLFKKSIKIWGTIILSMFIGIFSHLLWDSFTHRAGFFENKLTFLSTPLQLFGNDIIPFVFLQFWSSIVGGLYIIYFILKRTKNQLIPSNNQFIKYWLLVFTICVLIVIGRQCATIEQFIATTLSGGLIGIIGSSLFFGRLTNK